MTEKEIKEAPPAPVATPTSAPAPTPTSTTKPAKKKSKWWLWTCLGCSIFLIIFVIVLVLIGMKVFEKIDKSLDQHEQIQETEYQEYQEAVEEGEIVDRGKYQILDTNTYKIKEKVTLTNNGSGDASRIDLRMAMIKDIKPYQDVINENITAPEVYNIVGDDFNNKYANFDFPGLKVGEDIVITAEYEVKVNSLKYNLSNCTGDTIDEFLSSEKYVESDNQKIKNKAKSLAQGDKNKCITAEDIYDYVADNVEYEGYVPQDQGALNSFNKLSGDCTDFADLYLGLSRAANIPARFLEGLGYAEDAQVPSDVKHDWAEINLPGVGWTQVDPTWGRYEASRDDHFARTDGSHIIITKGRNLEVLNNAHYFAYNYWWEGAEASVEFTEDWDIELVE